MIRFLQISDIHFTDKSGNDDEYAQMKRKFLEDLAACRQDFGVIDYVLICGDIAFSGLETQYRKARKFIDDIIEKTKCDKNNVLMVPGNHDKKWDVYSRTRWLLRDQLIKTKNTRQLLESKVKEPLAVGILYAPFKQYYKLAADYLSISGLALKASAFPESDQKIEDIPKFEPDDSMYWTEKLGELKGYQIAIHGSNSSLLSDKDDGESWTITREENKNKHLQVLPLQAYNVTAGSEEIHILMLHHPMSEINDEKIIGPDIDNRFKLQFYGHVHKQSSSCDGVIKIYSGALQPPEEENNKEYFPIYNVIEVDVVDEGGDPKLKVNVFCRKWDGSKFDEYTEETKVGKNALKVNLPKNDAWKKTMESIARGESFMEETEKTKEIRLSHATKHAFLESENKGRIIKELYGTIFDSVSPNRIKYITFLNQVEKDGKIIELNEILKKYGK